MTGAESPPPTLVRPPRASKNAGPTNHSGLCRPGQLRRKPGSGSSGQRRRIDLGERDLVQFLIRRFFLFERLIQELRHVLMTASLGERTDRTVGGNLVVFYLLSTGDQGGVQGSAGS